MNGRPYQGDALYVRDLGFDHEAERAACLSPDKILKLAAIFALSGHGDQAAEVLIQFRSRIADLLDVDRALDLLTHEAHDVCASVFSNEDRGRTYAQYMAKFEANGPGAYGADRRNELWLRGWIDRGHQASERAQAAEQALSGARRELDQIHGSKSWRLTRWLRGLRRSARAGSAAAAS